MIATLFAQASNIAPVEEKIGLFQMMQRGGPLMVVLFVCSVVAIPCYLAHNFLVAQVHSLVADMERDGIETIHTLTDLPRKDMIAVPFKQPISEIKDAGEGDQQSKKA